MPKAESSPSPSSAGNASTSSKKRKRGPGNPSPKQQTIQQLFSAPQQKSSLSKAGNSNSSPRDVKLNDKRQKLEPSTLIKSSPLAAESMYTFSNAKPNNVNNVIDLTGGPTSSPPRKITKPVLLGHQGGARRIVVKNLKTSRQNTQLYYDQIAEKLDLALASVLRSEKQLPVSMEELYRGVENICKQGRAADLCARLRSEMESHAVKTVQRGLSDQISKDTSSSKALWLVLTQWEIWKNQWALIRGIFFYMDRTHLLNSRSQSLQDLSIDLFLNSVLQDDVVKEQMLEGVCELIELDRSGKSFDASLSKNAISMFIELGIYTRSFEPLLLDKSQTFVANWATSASAVDALADYVQHALDLIDSELKRCDAMGINSTTKTSLLALLEEHLIKQQKDRLIDNDEIADLLDANAVQDLEKLYSLLRRCNLSESIRAAFQKWIEDTGTAIVLVGKKDEQAKKLHEDQMVIKLLTLKKQLDHLCIESFHRNSELMHGVRAAFEKFINKTEKTAATHGTDNSKAGEMIAKYVNMLLRGGIKAIPTALSKTASIPEAPEEDENEMEDEDSEINEQLDQVLDLFRFLHGKAVFEAFYKVDLAKRLLTGRSASADAELSMLSRLNTECGSGFTQNLEKMFKDIELSREEMAEYKARQSESDTKPSLDLFVNVLSVSAWPSYPDIPINVPSAIQQACEKFEKSYQAHHSGRSLKWKHKLANCLLIARFPSDKRPKELVASGFQGIVLLLFSNVELDEKISYERIKVETGLADIELKSTLQELACAKIRPLKKHPQGKDVNVTDSFSFNASFTHPKHRIKINQIQLKETKEENKETHERVQADRNFETQAAIVRIMKSKKTIGHNLLIAEVIESTRKRGVLSIPDIKRNIDRLIEKEYMEREEGKNRYNYLA